MKDDLLYTINTSLILAISHCLSCVGLHTSMLGYLITVVRNLNVCPTAPLFKISHIFRVSQPHSAENRYHLVIPKWFVVDNNISTVDTILIITDFGSYWPVTITSNKKAGVSTYVEVGLNAGWKIVSENGMKLRIYYDKPLMTMTNLLLFCRAYKMVNDKEKHSQNL